MTTDLESLENELRRQLGEIDSIVQGEGEDGLAGRRGGGDALSVFEQATAEGEREALQDRLASLLARSEDFETQQSTLRELAARNEELQRENTLLKKFRDEYIEEQKVAAAAAANSDLEERYKDLEFKLAEARSKLARAQQAQDDHLIAREASDKLLEREKQRSAHLEKERDAYAAAYEASLKHFERWSQKRVGQPQDATAAAES